AALKKTAANSAGRPAGSGEAKSKERPARRANLCACASKDLKRCLWPTKWSFLTLTRPLKPPTTGGSFRPVLAKSICTLSQKDAAGPSKTPERGRPTNFPGWAGSTALGNSSGGLGSRRSTNDRRKSAGRQDGRPRAAKQGHRTRASSRKAGGDGRYRRTLKPN